MKINTFKPLATHYENLKNENIKDLVNENTNDFVFNLDELHLDASKNLFTKTTLDLFVQYSNEIKLTETIKDTFLGAKSNFTENRAVLHTALRNPNLTSLVVDGKDYASDIKIQQDKMLDFVDKIKNGSLRTFSGEKFENVVNIGIGGSYLGVLMGYEALKSTDDTDLNVYFISNVDFHNTQDILGKIDLSKTLFIIASKTFTTQETMLNANTIKHIFIQKVSQQAVSMHFVALSTNLTEVANFGIKQEYIFGFWDFVGGRYSIWSVIGMALALKIGSKNFKQFLHGANVVDNHFVNTPLERNIPFVLASIATWYNNFFQRNAYAILCYDYRLGKFTQFIQQLEMESNGKMVNNNNEFINYATSPIVFGEVGTDSQHSFFQAIHQGSSVIPVDFIGFIKPNHNHLNHHNVLLANLIAQSEALMIGRSKDEVLAENKTLTKDSLTLNHRVFLGNRPSNIMLFKELNAKTLGMLCAIYEHKVFVQGLMWQINSFDQFGVELGKVVANGILQAIEGNESEVKKDEHYSKSTLQLIDLVKSKK